MPPDPPTTLCIITHTQNTARPHQPHSSSMYAPPSSMSGSASVCHNDITITPCNNDNNEPYWYHPSYTATMRHHHGTTDIFLLSKNEWLNSYSSYPPVSCNNFCTSHPKVSTAIAQQHIGPWFAEILNTAQNRPYQVIWHSSIQHYTVHTI